MNDPHYHPYASNGYRGFMRSDGRPLANFAPRGMPVGRRPDHGIRRAVGRRMGHVPPEIGCTGGQGDQDNFSSRSLGVYAGVAAFEGQAFHPRYTTRGRSSRGPGRPRGRRGLRRGYSPAGSHVYPMRGKRSEESSLKEEVGLSPTSQPTRTSTNESTRTGSNESTSTNKCSKLKSPAKTLSSKSCTDVKSQVTEEKLSSSTKDECVQTSGQIPPLKQPLRVSTSESKVSVDKQTAKIQPFNHSPTSICTATESSTAGVSFCTGETSYTTIVHVTPQSNQQPSQQGVPTSLRTIYSAKVSADGTLCPTTIRTYQCFCQSRHRFKEKYGDKGASTCDPIVIDSDDEEKSTPQENALASSEEEKGQPQLCTNMPASVLLEAMASNPTNQEAGESSIVTSPQKKRAKMSAYTQDVANPSSCEVQTPTFLSATSVPSDVDDSLSLSLANTISDISERLRNGISSSSSSSSGSSSPMCSTSSVHITEDAPLLANPQMLNCMLAEAKQERPGKKLRLTARNLYMAAKCCNISKILGLLGEGCNPNQQVEQEKGKSAMHVAAAAGYIDVLALLRNSGGDFNFLDHSGRTPMFEAVENHKVRAVQYLIEAGADLRVKDEDGMTTLHVAARRGYTDLITRLYNSGKFDINLQDKGGWTPIMWSADDKHSDATRCLIELGANVHLRDQELNTPLHWAACAGVLDVSEMLLNHNADLNWQNEHGDTALHIAARECHYTCVLLYCNRGARLDIKNKHGETPVEVAPEGTRCNSFLKSKKELLASQGPVKFRFLCSDITRGRENLAITCINEVDDDPLPEFNYVMNSCEVSNVHVDFDVKSLERCDCEDSCRNGVCSCGQKGDGERIWYKWSEEHGVSLLQNGIHKFDRPLVYECNRMCKCWSYCQNKVVQRGIKFPLQVFKTESKSWGLRSLGPIPQGAFVCEYSGEWISDAEAEERCDDSYLFDVDCKENEDDLHCIDAKTYGSIGRFINHSCEPNVSPVRVFIEHQDIRFPRIALFASRNIQMNDEICFNYGDRFWEVKKKEFRCSCGVPSCKYKGTPEKN